MKAYINLRTSLAASMVQGYNGIDPKELALLLLSLPPGSRITGFTETKIPEGALFYETKVFVENPMFQNEGEIRQDYVRMAGIDFEKDKLIQFNNFKGLNLGPLINTKGIDNS